jgi:hypothetical protein
MPSSGRDFLRLCGVAIVMDGLAAALTLLFIPLSVQRAASGAVTGGAARPHLRQRDPGPA